MNVKIRQAWAIALAAGTSIVALADAPRVIPFQGRLVGIGTTTVTLDIAIHKHETTVSPQFSETHLNVPVTDGIFSIMIGSLTGGGITDAAFDGPVRWISVSVDGSPDLAPRTQLALVPFAARALHADSLLQDTNGVNVAVSADNLGRITMFDDNGDAKFKFTGEGAGLGGTLTMVAGDALTETVEIAAAGGFTGGASLAMRHADGSTAITLNSDESGTAGTQMSMYNGDGTVELFELQAAETSTTGPQLFLRQSNGITTVDFDAEFGALGGAQMSMSNGPGTTTILLDADATNDAGQLVIDDGAGTARLVIDADNPTNGLLAINNVNGDRVFRVTTIQSGSNGQMTLYNQSGIAGVDMISFNSTTGGRIYLKDGVTGSDTIRMWADNGSNDAEIQLRNGAAIVMRLIANDANGDSRVVTDVLEIVGGADLSEQFDVSGENQPGMVVSIDPKHPGQLLVAHSAYDRKVAGIISGAGGVKPGMLMGQSGTIADGQHAVALTGRVWCYVDASFGAIEPGDLLTTSDTRGHAMKVTDHEAASGAIIGKAMTSLDEGQGLVLVLVSLQ